MLEVIKIESNPLFMDHRECQSSSLCVIILDSEILFETEFFNPV